MCVCLFIYYIKIKLKDPPNRMYYVFIGGAVLAKIMND